MSDIRLICLDMDGTLLDDDHATVPPRNVAALRAAAERGAAVTIASGRAWSLLRAVDAQIGVTRYAVLSNGAAVLDVTTGEWLYRRPMDPNARRTILTLLLDWGLPFEVYCEGENYIQADRTEQVVGSALSPEFAQVLRSVSHFPEDLNAALEGKAVEKIHIFHVDIDTFAASFGFNSHRFFFKFIIFSREISHFHNTLGADARPDGHGQQADNAGK